MKAHVLAAALVAAAGTPVASAQDAWKSDVFAGYTMLATDGETLHGWQAALGWDVSGRIGLLLDVSGHEGTDAGGTDVSALSLMAGPRFRLGGGRVRPFVHVIGGLVRSKASIAIGEVEISESTTDLGGAAGGGVELGFGERWAGRVAADYRVVKVEDETAGDPRLSIGVVYRFGH
jgi:opacity protein-like surface antigen